MLDNNTLNLLVTIKAKQEEAEKQVISLRTQLTGALIRAREQMAAGDQTHFIYEGYAFKFDQLKNAFTIEKIYEVR